MGGPARSITGPRFLATVSSRSARRGTKTTHRPGSTTITNRTCGWWPRCRAFTRGRLGQRAPAVWREFWERRTIRSNPLRRLVSARRVFVDDRPRRRGHARRAIGGRSARPHRRQLLRHDHQRQPRHFGRSRSAIAAEKWWLNRNQYVRFRGSIIRLMQPYGTITVRPGRRAALAVRAIGELTGVEFANSQHSPAILAGFLFGCHDTTLRTASRRMPATNPLPCDIRDTRPPPAAASGRATAESLYYRRSIQ